MPGPRRYLRIEGDLAFIPLTKGYEDLRLHPTKEAAAAAFARASQDAHGEFSRHS
jgi:hypothetical protein